MTLIATWRKSCSVVLLALLATSSALANPSDKQPHASIDIHGQEHAPQLLDAAQQMAEQNRAALEKFDKLIKDNRIQKIDPIELGKVNVNANRLRRAAEQLRLLGEPAGVDYHYRAALHSQAVGQIVLALRAIPAAQPGIAKLVSRASEVASQHAKNASKIEKLVERKDWEAAEREWLQVEDDVEVFAIYMAPEQRVGLYSPWDNVRVVIPQTMDAKRREEAAAYLKSRADAAKPDHAKLLLEVQAAAASVQKSGKHTIDGKELSGPELIGHFDTAWQKAQVATLKALAIEWARGHGVSTTLPTPEWKSLRSDYENFAKAVGLELARLIAGDAARVDTASASALYAAYLPAVADLVDHCGGDLESALQASLDQLAAKAPELKANIDHYRAATDEVLRWRERIASEQAKAKDAAFPAARPLVRTAYERSTESGGLYVPEAPEAPPELLDAAAKALFFGSPKLVGKDVSIADIVALGGASQAGIARYQDRIYARLTLPIAAMQEEVASLETQLFVTSDQPPLSLSATRAIRSARRGDLVCVGGAVSGVFLEGHITRFATLPDAAALLTSLGKLPPDYRETDQLEQVVLRLDLAPKWVRQRYFFVELSEATPK